MMTLLENRFEWVYVGYDSRRLFQENVELWTTSLDLDFALLGFWFSGSLGRCWGYDDGNE